MGPLVFVGLLALFCLVEAQKLEDKDVPGILLFTPLFRVRTAPLKLEDAIRKTQGFCTNHSNHTENYAM